MFTIMQAANEWLNSSTPETFDQTLDSLTAQVSETSSVKWAHRVISLAAGVEAYGRSKKYFSDTGSVFVFLGVSLLSRVLTDRLLVQPKITKLRQDYHQLSDQLERRKQADSASLRKLEGMTGLNNLKKYVVSLRNKMLVQELRKKAGLKCDDCLCHHMLFTGNPGTGKTLSARSMTHILYELGMIKDDKMVTADRSALVAKHVGGTAIKTEKLVKSARNGVLFIEEAYSLFKESGGDFGSEAIEKLLVLLEDDDINTVVIMAGYQQQMEQFIDSNPGFRSRVPVTIHFDDYSDGQLIDLFQYLCQQNGYALSDESLNICKEKLSDLKRQEGERFANGRSVRNFFERVKTAQETRLVNENELVGLSGQTDGNNESTVGQESALTVQQAEPAEEIVISPAENTDSSTDGPSADATRLMTFLPEDVEAAAAIQLSFESRGDSDWMEMYV